MLKSKFNAGFAIMDIISTVTQYSNVVAIVFRESEQLKNWKLKMEKTVIKEESIKALPKQPPKSSSFDLY